MVAEAIASRHEGDPGAGGGRHGARTVARRYLPEEYAQGFVEAELTHPTSQLVLFTVRPDRWLSFDFADE